MIENWLISDLKSSKNSLDSSKSSNSSQDGECSFNSSGSELNTPPQGSSSYETYMQSYRKHSPVKKPQYVTEEGRHLEHLQRLANSLGSSSSNIKQVLPSTSANSDNSRRYAPQNVKPMFSPHSMPSTSHYISTHLQSYQPNSHYIAPPCSMVYRGVSPLSTNPSEYDLRITKKPRHTSYAPSDSSDDGTLRESPILPSVPQNISPIPGPSWVYPQMPNSSSTPNQTVHTHRPPSYEPPFLKIGDPLKFSPFPDFNQLVGNTPYPLPNQVPANHLRMNNAWQNSQPWNGNSGDMVMRNYFNRFRAFPY